MTVALGAGVIGHTLGNLIETQHMSLLPTFHTLEPGLNDAEDAEKPAKLSKPSRPISLSGRPAQIEKWNFCYTDARMMIRKACPSN